MKGTPLRIGMIAPPWLPVPPPLYGGTESIIDRLACAMHAAGHDVLLFTTADSCCPVPKQWVLQRADSVRIGMAVVEMRHLLHAYEAMLKWGADIVHDHTTVGPLYAQRFPGLPVVTTNHGPFNDDLRDIYRAAADHAGIICISRNQRDSAPEIPVARVIHHGLDPEAFPVGKGDGGYFAFLGRMTPDKGAKEAACVAAQAGVSLKIAAKMREPAEVEYFEEQVRPCLSDRIEYIGEVGGPEKLELLGGAVALLNPIKWAEPFGLVMIESLACGTPVVAFPEGAAPEIIDDGVTGFLCDDDEQMAKTLECVGDLDRAACRAAVEGYFSTARMVSEHLEVYEELIKLRGAGVAPR